MINFRYVLHKNICFEYRASVLNQCFCICFLKEIKKVANDTPYNLLVENHTIFKINVFCAEIQDDLQTWWENKFWQNMPDDSLVVKNFVYIAPSHTVFELNAFLDSGQNFKMAGK